MSQILTEDAPVMEQERFADRDGGDRARQGPLARGSWSATTLPSSPTFSSSISSSVLSDEAQDPYDGPSEPEESQLIMPSLDIPTTDDAGSSQTIAVLASEDHLDRVLDAFDGSQIQHRSIISGHNAPMRSPWLRVAHDPESLLCEVEAAYAKADKVLLRHAPSDPKLQMAWRSVVSYTLNMFDCPSAVIVAVQGNSPHQKNLWRQLSAMSQVLTVIPVHLEDLANPLPPDLDMSDSFVQAKDLGQADREYLTLSSLHRIRAHSESHALLQSKAISNFTHWRHLATPSLYRQSRVRATGSASSLASARSLSSTTSRDRSCRRRRPSEETDERPGMWISCKDPLAGVTIKQMLSTLGWLCRGFARDACVFVDKQQPRDFSKRLMLCSSVLVTSVGLLAWWLRG